ncbi:MAG: pyridoxamine 5'-phosphate oxidase family protein [Oscillospiraceae bacterium]|nr:pyridoxamine 5'-phosphate oxidase family protein [Oscillospiraceae bacterium]
MGENIRAEIIKLRKNSKFAYVGSVSEEGFPQIKCMFTIKSDDTQTHYFSTNTSSKRVAQFLSNPKASVYYCNELMFKGAMFTGTMEVCKDRETKERFWNKGDEKYYPKGVDDEDYCILKFTAESVNYYHGLANTTLSIEEEK